MGGVPRVKDSLKRLASRLPVTWQQGLKRSYLRRKIRRGEFRPDEPEFDLLPELIREGDWVLDIGANIGHYTLRFSELVGASGRVVAFEPIPATFELLAANVRLAAHPNVSLLNAAASDSTREARMAIPRFERTGLANYYQAHLSDESEGMGVLCMPVDALSLPGRVTLVKIDAEGHELPVVEGMKRLLGRDRPALIVEDSGPTVGECLAAMGYHHEKIPGSPNRLFRPARSGRPT